MKGNRDVINQLNQVLYHHLTAINQYFLHSRMFNDWGIEQLGSAEYKESIRQMKHADKIIDRYTIYLSVEAVFFGRKFTFTNIVLFLIAIFICCSINYSPY
ncbi:ferritin-like domain-containing protein, partial [Acinetobacter baumannii]|uniref:ferritin-like domain-containing protein n=1 Tax=Acinetobacter baumannii TaxID=470 RepID=UPI0022791076